MIYEDCEGNSLSKLDGTQVTTLKRPTNDDPVAWEEYWDAQGQDWRWEPEIDAERQKYLDERRNKPDDFLNDIHPFENIHLNRADVEWLLATHEGGRGPVDWNDESQRKRDGLNLLRADLSHANLSKLPLSNCNFRRVQLQGANLREALLQGAHLREALLQGPTLERHCYKRLIFGEHNFRKPISERHSYKELTSEGQYCKEQYYMKFL